MKLFIYLFIYFHFKFYHSKILTSLLSVSLNDFTMDRLQGRQMQINVRWGIICIDQGMTLVT
jgi:hypothetical protein